MNDDFSDSVNDFDTGLDPISFDDEVPVDFPPDSPEPPIPPEPLPIPKDIPFGSSEVMSDVYVKVCRCCGACYGNDN